MSCSLLSLLAMLCGGFMGAGFSTLQGLTHSQRRAMAKRAVAVSAAGCIDSDKMADLERASERQLTRGGDFAYADAAMVAGLIDNRGMVLF
eukprot:1182907-Prorocentrum_minimum.AAC.7